MAILPVLTFPDDRLRTKASVVDNIDENIHRLVEDMIETMYAEEGIGLAATQVDVHKRIIVIDVSDEQNEPLVFINPEVIAKEGENGIEEGCLSLPDSRALVLRANTIRVNALNKEGESFTTDADDLLAICLQHELDHLEGKLFIDHISPIKRKRIQDKLTKIKKIKMRQAKKDASHD